MADIAAGDVSYSLVKKSIHENCERLFVFDVSFGDGALTYPAGGIPLTGASLGLPNAVHALVFVNEAHGNGFIYKFDPSNLKVRIYQEDNAAGDGPLIEVVSGSHAPAATTLRVEARGF